MSPDRTPSPVKVCVLGGIEVDGRALAPPDGQRAVALLGWLAVHRGLHPRTTIASALWPDVTDASARQSVRTALWSLRRALGDLADHILDVSASRIGLRNVSVDVERFEELVAEGDSMRRCSGLW